MFDRLEARNAVDREHADALADAFREFERSPPISRQRTKGVGLLVEQAMRREFARGVEVLDDARAGAEQFAAGEGRRGAF